VNLLVPEEQPRRRAKVLLVIPNLQQGGAERQILELLRRLPEDRFEPVLCLWHHRPHYQTLLPAGQPRHVLGVESMGAVGLRRLIAVLREERPDILHSYRDTANLWSRLAVLGAPVPVVLTSSRNRSMAISHLVAEPFLHRLSDRVLTNSAGIERELVARARVPKEKVRVLHNFIDLGRFRPPSEEERQAARRRFGLEADEIAFVLPGRLSYQKHQLGVVLAAALLARRGALPPGLRILFAGRPTDRLYAGLLPGLIRRLRLDGVFRFLGVVEADAMPALYHAVDAVVLPSIYEGFPNALVEAHASGLPAIASADADADGIVVPEVSGLKVRTWSVPALAAALARLAGMTAGERRRMGELGRRNISERFHPERILEEVVDLYEELLREKGAA